MQIKLVSSSYPDTSLTLVRLLVL